MSDYMPVTSQVRETFAHDDRAEYEDPITYPTFVKDQRHAFNRWLAAHDAEIRTAALEEAADHWSEWEAFKASDGIMSVRQHGLTVEAWLRERAITNTPASNANDSTEIESREV